MPTDQFDSKHRVFWQLSADDRPDSFREGTGFVSLMKAMRELVETETLLTPEGYTPSGNVSLYWNEVQEPVEDEVVA